MRKKAVPPAQRVMLDDRGVAGHRHREPVVRQPCGIPPAILYRLQHGQSGKDRAAGLLETGGHADQPIEKAAASAHPPRKARTHAAGVDDETRANLTPAVVSAKPQAETAGDAAAALESRSRAHGAAALQNLAGEEGIEAHPVQMPAVALRVEQKV